MKRIHMAVLVMSGLSLFATGCAKKSVDDSTLKSAIETRLASDPATKDAKVTVAVKDGAVTLSGDVPSSDAELGAMKIANGTDGVRNVSDQMKVSAAAVAPPTPAPTTSPAAPAPVPSSTAATAPGTSATDTAAPAAPPARRSRAATAGSAGGEERPVGAATVTVPAGTRVSVRTIEAIDSSTATEGQSYRASLDSPMIARGRVVVPAGADVGVVVSGVQSAGRIKGQSSLSLHAASVQYQGHSYSMSTSGVTQVGKSRGKNTALKTGIGAAAGALIGGLAGGGKGAGIGAAAGGGAGFGWNALVKGGQVKIPSETVLNFQLSAPLTVTPGRVSE